jgi:hypothetical protein
MTVAVKQCVLSTKLSINQSNSVIKILVNIPSTMS